MDTVYPSTNTGMEGIITDMEMWRGIGICGGGGGGG